MFKLLKYFPFLAKMPSFTPEEFPSCNYDDKEEWECGEKILDQVWYNVSKTNACPKACSILQYTGKIFYEEIYEKEYQSINYNEEVYKIKFKYVFASPETVTVYEEYLIYDTIGMIGSIGGTLGMCIGFSFATTISTMLSFFQRKLRH